MNRMQIQSALEQIEDDLHMLEFKYDNLYSNPQALEERAALIARKRKLEDELCTQ